MSENSSAASSSVKKSYSVTALYKKSWEVVKKNVKSLAIITLIGVGVSVVVTILTTFLIVNNIANDLSSALVSGLVTAAVSILSGVFVGLLQIISLKKATEGKPVVPGEVINESKKFIPRALQYGLFVVAVVVASAIVIGLVSAAIGPVGALLGLAFVVAMIIAAFRYAFLQYIVVESHEMAFMDRFKLSQKLTDGIYGTIFLAALMGFVLGIGAGLVSGALSSPFKTSTKNIDTTFQTRFDNVQTEEDFYDAFDDARDEVAKQSLDANYVIRQIITGVISWGVGLITMGAFLELYKERRAELKL